MEGVLEDLQSDTSAMMGDDKSPDDSGHGSQESDSAVSLSIDSTVSPSVSVLGNVSGHLPPEDVHNEDQSSTISTSISTVSDTGMRVQRIWLHFGVNLFTVPTAHLFYIPIL